MFNCRLSNDLIIIALRINYIRRNELNLRNQIKSVHDRSHPILYVNNRAYFLCQVEILRDIYEESLKVRRLPIR